MSEAPALSARAEARRERLLDAAETVFTREGLRGASMERIAGEAGVARATVYAYFTDKEDAFLQVSQRLADRLVDSVAAALAAQSTSQERIRKSILNKHLLAWKVARTSPHAADLFAAKDQLAAPIFRTAEAKISALIATHVSAINVATSERTAALILAASSGIAAAADSADELITNLNIFLDWVILAAPIETHGSARSGMQD